MSSANGSAKRSETGLLTPDNCVVALIDHQPQMLFGASNSDRHAMPGRHANRPAPTTAADAPEVRS